MLITVGYSINTCSITFVSFYNYFLIGDKHPVLWMGVNFRMRKRWSLIELRFFD